MYQVGRSYGFSHSTVMKGNLYYRLKMIDIDESFRYSRMITVSKGVEEPGENSCKTITDQHEHNEFAD